MERVGAGNFIGSAAGNLSLDDANGCGAKGTGGGVTSLRGRQESPFEGGAKSFLSSTHLRSVDSPNATKGGEMALLGEVLDLLKQVVSLVEQWVAAKGEGASSASPSSPSSTDNKTPEASDLPFDIPASNASSTAPAATSTSGLIGEVLSLLQTLIELLEEKFGSGNEAKPGDGANGPDDVANPASPQSNDGDILSQVLELVSQLIELIQQKFGTGNDTGDSSVNVGEGDASALQGIADIKDRLDSIAQQTQNHDVVPEEAIAEPSEPAAPAEAPLASGPADADILSEIVSILNRIISLLQQVSDAPAEAAE